MEYRFDRTNIYGERNFTVMMILHALYMTSFYAISAEQDKRILLETSIVDDFGFPFVGFDDEVIIQNWNSELDSNVSDCILYAQDQIKRLFNEFRPDEKLFFCPNYARIKAYELDNKTVIQKMLNDDDIDKQETMLYHYWPYKSSKVFLLTPNDFTMTIDEYMHPNKSGMIIDPFKVLKRRTLFTELNKMMNEDVTCVFDKQILIDWSVNCSDDINAKEMPKEFDVQKFMKIVRTIDKDNWVNPMFLLKNLEMYDDLMMNAG